MALDLDGDGERCVGYAASGVERSFAPTNLDESRHHQRCQDPRCAGQHHQPYRDREQQRYVPPVELGHADWHVVWGFTHLTGTPKRRCGVPAPWET